MPSAPASISFRTSSRISSSCCAVGCLSSKPITFSRIVVAPMKQATLHDTPRLNNFFGRGIGRLAHATHTITPNRDLHRASFASATVINSATLNKKVELCARRRRFHSTSWRCHITQSYDGTEKGVTPCNHLSNLSWPIQSTPRFRASVLTVFEDRSSVDENIFHSGGVLGRVFESGVIGDRCRIEHHHIGEHSFFQKSAMIQPEISRRQGGQSPDGFRQGDQLFVARIFAEHTGEGSIGARMRSRFQEDAFRSLRSLIRAEGNPRFGDFFSYVLF